MITVHNTLHDAQIKALSALGIFTVTDLCRYADANSVRITDLLEATNV